MSGIFNPTNFKDLGGILTKTLAEKILRDFSRVKLKKATVKVPKLKVKNKKVIKLKKDDSFPISSIINILIRTAVEKAKRERKRKSALEEDKKYSLFKDDRELKVNGGYGTVSRDYGASPHTSYVDYGKLFSYLGKFRSQSAYENMDDDHFTRINKSLDDKGFSLIDKNTMEKGTRYVKYVAGSQDINTLSLVPVAGMSSAEWEQFKLWMKLDPVMYRLKTSTS